MDAICVPFNGEALKWHPVTTAMSNMRYQGDDCAKEVKKGNIASFFTKPKGETCSGALYAFSAQ